MKVLTFLEMCMVMGRSLIIQDRKKKKLNQMHM